MGYSNEVKQQALQLSDKFGIQEAADMLGLKYSTVAGFRYRRNNQYGRAQSRKDSTSIIAEIDKRIEELKRAKKILQNTLGSLQQ